MGRVSSSRVATGYSFKVLKTDGVAVAFFGDGAVNNGAFHEGLNMAGIWKLPVLFVCENNQYATEVPFKYAAGHATVAARAAAYGLPGVEVDGNDVAAVHRAAEEAVDRARAGNGATLLECLTYRTRPHAEGMGDFGYRTKEEVEEWKARCPIRRLKETLLDEGVDEERSEPRLKPRLKGRSKRRIVSPSRARRLIPQPRRTMFMRSRCGAKAKLRGLMSPARRAAAK